MFTGDFNKNKKGPEAAIQDSIVNALRLREWTVMETHGNLYQWGFPDIYAYHPHYGQRWIEVKLPGMKGSKFTPAQKKYFPLMDASKIGRWILTGATDMELNKLFQPPNWRVYYLLEMHRERTK